MLTYEATAHMRAVGVHVEALVASLNEDLSARSVDRWVTAAYLHDIGNILPGRDYHTIRGARFLRNAGFGRKIARALAWQTTTSWEVVSRHLRVVELIEEFGDAPVGSVSHDAIWVADFTTTPDGFPTTVASRLASLHSRYEGNEMASRALDMAMPNLRRACARFGVEV